MLPDRIRRVLDDYSRRWHSLSAAGPENFRHRRWKAQRSAMAERVLLGETAVRALQQLCSSEEWPERWSEVCREVRRHDALPEPLSLALLFALSQLVLPVPDCSLTDQVPDPRQSAEAPGLVTTGGSAGATAQKLAELLRSLGLGGTVEDELFLAGRLKEAFPAEELRADFLPRLLFRNQHAYLVGSVSSGPAAPQACCVPLVHRGPSPGPDAFLVGEPAVTRVFEFTRSPFLLESPDPMAVLRYLCRILPHKDPAQLAMNLGFTELGEALLVRQWQAHAARTAGLLRHAPGTPGLVMLTFCLEDFPVVFKVVRNRARPPKNIARAEVMERYAWVAQQDRAGRMADAQRFSAWSFPWRMFAPELRAELLAEASDILRLEGDHAVLLDVITERRLEPLNLFLRSRPGSEAVPVVLDYGRAIREMAMCNIFPGDLLLKNFGVTPAGRVVFYDYDEVCALTECRFRDIPPARTPEDEMAAEPWYSVGPGDVFPEEFAAFITPAGDAGQALRDTHADLFTARFWNQWRSFHQEGGLVDLQPYESQRSDSGHPT